MDFFLFILVNATLFLRPAELFPSMAEIPLYNILILLCLASAFPQTLDQLSLQRLISRPITACVVAMIPAIMLSHLSHFDTWSAREYAIEFSKVVIYYLLLVGIVNTPSRLKSFLAWIVLFTMSSSALALLHYHEYIEIPSLTAMEQWEENPETGERELTHRLRATGIFNDPNDLSMIVVTALSVCIHTLFDRNAGALRLVYLVPLGLLGVTLAYTQSRGGFLAFLVASLVFLYCRYGTGKTIAAMAVILPAMLVLFAGRQTDIFGALSEGTGESRVELWSEGIQMIKSSPFFGIGSHLYADEAGLVAHNSFVHALAELGFLGGAFFVGAFYFAILSPWTIGRQRLAYAAAYGESALGRLQPCIFAIVAAAAASLMSLSRCYTASTYISLGLAATYTAQAARAGYLPPNMLGLRQYGRLIALSAGFLALVYVYIKVAAR